jgi:tetratricopeptide (TPR) repeat protein
MSDKTTSSLFMFPPLLKYAGFYQQLLRNAASYQQLCNRLIWLGENAHVFRQFNTVKEVGQILAAFSLKNYQPIGHYFLAVSSNSGGMGDQQQAKELFELAAETAPQPYKARAILSLAAVSANTADFDSELYYLNESLRAAESIDTKIRAYRGIALHKSREGHQKHALDDLEQLLPVIRFAEPFVYFDYLNSLAVELGEAGRKYEARNIIRHVLASPFAPSYPEWQQTADDLRPASRSFVAFKSARIRKAKLLHMPPTERGKPTEAGSLAPVISLSEWKAKMVKYSDKPNIDDMKESEILMEIMNRLSGHEVTYQQRRKILEFIRQIMTEPPKDEDED